MSSGMNVTGRREVAWLFWLLVPSKNAALVSITASVQAGAGWSSQGFHRGHFIVTGFPHPTISKSLFLLQTLFLTPQFWTFYFPLCSTYHGCNYYCTHSVDVSLVNQTASHQALIYIVCYPGKAHVPWTRVLCSGMEDEHCDRSCVKGPYAAFHNNYSSEIRYWDTNRTESKWRKWQQILPTPRRTDLILSFLELTTKRTHWVTEFSFVRYDLHECLQKPSFPSDLLKWDHCFLPANGTAWSEISPNLKKKKDQKEKKRDIHQQLSPTQIPLYMVCDVSISSPPVMVQLTGVLLLLWPSGCQWSARK